MKDESEAYFRERRQQAVKLAKWAGWPEPQVCMVLCVADLLAEMRRLREAAETGAGGDQGRPR